MRKKSIMKEKALNYLLLKGKKPVAEKIFTKSLKEIQKTSKKQTKKVIINAVALVTPLLKVLVFRQKKRKKKKNKRGACVN